MPDSHHRVLFVCVHNSARSQMAEAFLEDPSTFKGTEEEVLTHAREIRDGIEKAILGLIRNSSMISYWI